MVLSTDVLIVRCNERWRIPKGL